MFESPLISLRISIRLLEAAQLPRHKCGLLHGTLGKALHRISPEAFLLLFGEAGEDFPRPFTLLPPLTICQSFLPGAVLVFEINLFGQATNHFHGIINAVEWMGDNGWGETRTPFAIENVNSFLPSGHEKIRSNHIAATSLKNIHTEASTRCHTQDLVIDANFLTPLRIKQRGNIMQTTPTLANALHTLFRRINQLSGTGHPAIESVESRALLKKAESSYISYSDLTWCDWERYSARQKATMQFGGLTGKLQWCNVSPDLLPWISLMQWLSLGSKTTFGLGQIGIDCPCLTPFNACDTKYDGSG